MIICNCNLYLGRLDNLKGIYEGSSCEVKCGCVIEYDVRIVKEESEFCEGSDILVELQSCI